MNKFLIILLAICLVSVCHAFVKRDAPEAPKSDGVQDLAKQLEDLAKSIQDKAKEIMNSEQVKEAFDPENIKKKVDDAINTVKKTFENFQSSTPKAA